MTKFFVLFFLFLFIINKISCKNLYDGEKSLGNAIVNESLDTYDDDVFLIKGGYHVSSFNTHSTAKYVVSLHYMKVNTKIFGAQHSCGGTIISKQTVITAAHCLYSKKKGPVKKKNIKVVAGTPRRLQRTQHTQERDVKSLIIHRKYIVTQRTFDIGLLKLMKPFVFNEFVAAIPLPKGSYRVGDDCTVVGWGRMYENGPAPNEIIYSNITILPEAECNKLSLKMSMGNICASDLEDMEKGICKGDSGSPLICKGALTGIVSYGFGCDNGLPDIYTDVYHYKSWVDANNADLIRIRQRTAILHLAFLSIISHLMCI